MHTYYLILLATLCFNCLSAQNGINLTFNFATAGTNTPSGFIEDIGQAYGSKSNGQTYGWLLVSNSSPTDATAEARNREPNPDFDPIRETLIHLNRGNRPQLKWELAVPNGTYQVTVQAGDVDAEGGGNTSHVVKAEGVTMINHPISPGQFGTRTAAQNITVNDGRLTLDGTAGANTKINAVSIQSLDVLRFPAVVGAIPLDGASNVDLNSSISANFLFLPNVSSGGATSLDNSTINNNTVKLFKVNGNSATQVSASVNGTGGGDAINLSVPSSILDANSRYRYSINGVKDLAGATVFPYTAEFTTGNSSSQGGGNLDNVSFTKGGNVAAGVYTTLTIGPDGKLYGLQSTGNIDRWNINGNGTLSGKQTLNGLTSAYGGNRLAIGLTFAPNASSSNLIAYVSHSSLAFDSGPEWDGKLSRLTGGNLQNEQLIITNLPRSIRDHLTNSIVFDPNNNNVLYFNQGSNTAGGEPDGAWGFRPERLLSAATLKLDMSKLPSTLPLNVQTSENQSVINSANTNSPTMSDGTYNPYFANAPLTIYASGVRNAYDLIWHSNGQLYIPTNGTGGGSNSPASVNGTRRPNGSVYNGPSIPRITNNSTQRDFLFRVNPNSPVGYYGNPNPKRGEFVLNRGNIDEDNYPSNIQPDANYKGFAYDFQFNKSPNGVIEYKSGGDLQGAMIVCRFSGGSDLIALVPDGPNGDIGTSKIGIPGFTGFSKPLDLVEDTNTGNIYVSDYDTEQIVLLRAENTTNNECDIENLAIGKNASQSSNYNGNFTAEKANDNDTNASSMSITRNEANAWWEVDLGAVYDINTIKVVNRKDCCQNRLSDFYVFVSDVPFSSKNVSTTLNQAGVNDYFTSGAVGKNKKIDINHIGRYVRVQLSGSNYLQLTEVKVNGCASTSPPPTFSGCADTDNLAPGKSATQSSNYNGNFTADKANDNDTNAGSKSITKFDTNAWWEIDLGAVYDITRIKVVNRKDCCQDRLSDFYVFVSNEPFGSKDLSATLNQSGVSDYFFSGPTGNNRKFDANRSGRYVRVQLSATNYLQLTEVKINGCLNTSSDFVHEPTSSNILLAREKTDVLEEDKYHSLLFPNPVTDYLNLVLNPQYRDKNLDYRISNMNGQVMDAGKFNSAAKEVKIDVSIPKFETGTYFISLSHEGVIREVHRFVVVK